MKNIVLIHKKEGETPLQAMDRYKTEHSVCQDVKMTYAGRLDPMASGLLVALSGDTVHEKDQFLGLDKVYEVDVLLGFSTDTGDILGIVHDYQDVEVPDYNNLKEILSSCQGVFKQSYPAFSSKTVDGVPLWKSARQQVEITDMPTKQVEIFNIQYIGKTMVSAQELSQKIPERISKVEGNFRQQEIIEKWEQVLENVKNQPFSVMSLKVHCSSGTYMRVLAENIGQKIGIPALAWRIHRTKIGEYEL